MFLHRIPDIDFWPSRVPGSQILKQQKKRGVKKNLLSSFFVVTKKNHKILKLFYFWTGEEKKIWANLQRIIEFLTQKIVIKLSKL